MSFANELIYFQAYALLVLFFDFFFLTRRKITIFSPVPPILLMVGIVYRLYFFREMTDGAQLDFGLIMMLISLCSLFAYFNVVAFIKRGVTFSILINHASPAEERIDDAEYIDLELRYDEMKDHGWIHDENNAISLTPRGRFVLKIYKMFIIILGIESIG